MLKKISFSYIPVHDLSENQVRQIERLKEVHFARAGAMKEKQTHGDRVSNKKDRMGYAIASVNGEIVAITTALKRIINYDGQPVALGGIGGVCTNETFRRRGIATRLVEITMQKLKDAKCDVTYLCTDIKKLGKLYSRFGFIPIGKNVIFYGDSGRKYIEKGGMLAPVLNKKLFHEILDSQEPFDIQGGNW